MGADVAMVIRRVCLDEVDGEVVIVGKQVIRKRVIYIIKVLHLQNLSHCFKNKS